ncbi:MAG: preprotein translocase subunit SecE [Candidatus Omnitrophota bacterium]
MNKITKFISDVKVELKKVSWPTRRELINSTIVVIISVAVLTLFISFCDLIWSSSIKFVIR